MTELVRQDPYATASLTEKREYVSAIAQAGELLPKSLWTNAQMVDGVMQPSRPSPAKVLLLAETGAMLGLHPMAALTGIHIIEGKPSLSANLLGALVRRAGHKLRVSTTGSWADDTFVARAVLIREDDPDFEFVVEWTPARARQAGLAGKGNWSKYPEAMSKARAITEVIREGAPDVTMAAAYTPEELGAQVQGAEGEVVELVQAPKEQAPIQDPPVQPMSSPADEPEPAPKPRAARKPKAKAPSDETQAEVESRQKEHDDTDQGGTAAADAAAKARVKANQEARAAAEREEVLNVDPATAEVLGENEEYAEEVADEESGTDWAARLEAVPTYDEAKELYREAREAGILNKVITWGDADLPLGDAITAVGRSFSALEQQGAGE